MMIRFRSFEAKHWKRDGVAFYISRATRDLEQCGENADEYSTFLGHREKSDIDEHVAVMSWNS